MVKPVRSVLHCFSLNVLLVITSQKYSSNICKMLILLVGRLGKQAYIDIRLGSVRTRFSLVEDKNGLPNKKCGKFMDSIERKFAHNLTHIKS